MKMTLEQLLAEEMVKSLLGEYFVLTEDRIDDLIARFPNAKFNKQSVMSWKVFDPSQNGKYMPWIITQVAKGQLKLPDQGEHLRDNLMTFERLITIPAYDGPRDLYQIKSLEELDGVMARFGTLKSKGQEEKEKKIAGQLVVATAGAYQLLKITNSDVLNRWGWRAYSFPVKNPNWAPRPAVKPEDYPPDDISDRKWCIRWPRYANTYLSAGPFYLVLKNGGPYVGIVWERGECQKLENVGITTAIAEEIYPVVKDVLPTNLQGNCKVFGNMKFVYGDVKEGETHIGPIDLANTKVSYLPDNTTIRGTLDLTNCPIAQLPANLRVEGTLKISGTPITVLPDDLFIEDMEWSEPLTWEQVKAMFWRMRLPDMESHYTQHLKDEKAKPDAEKERDPETGKVKKPLTWPQMKKRLFTHFQQDTDVDKNVKTLYRYTPVKAREAAPTE